MDRSTKLIYGFLGLVLAIVGVLVLFIERVPVRTYGVRQSIWGGGGIEPFDYTTGYHLGITGLHKWAFLDSSTHFLEFVQPDERQGVASPQRQSYALFPATGRSRSDLSTPTHNRYPPLEIRNLDGNVVTIDVSVPYRIIKGMAHRIVGDGLRSTYQDRVKATVESVLREVLPEMSNEALQDIDKRMATAKKALDVLSKRLAQFHVEAEVVLLRRISFPPDYEIKLQQKQLLTQKANLDQANTLRFQEVLKTGTIEKEITAAEEQSRAQWEKKMETLRAEYAVLVATITTEAVQYSKRTKAEADATYETKLADGKLALDQAEAKLALLRSEVLSTAGGQIYVARLAAENLKIGRVVLNASDERVPLLFDLHKLAEMLIGAGGPVPLTTAK